MAKTEIPSEQILNADVRREDLNTSLPGNAVILKSSVGGIGISESHTGADVGTGDVTHTLKADGFGMNKAWSRKVSSESTSGATFTEYDSLDFIVTDTSTNEFRLNADFIWGHNAAANDIRIRLSLDGNVIGEELRIEPKDAGTDQRFQNNILDYLENLSLGTHTLSLSYRPASSNRSSRMYKSILEVWRIA